MWLLNPPGAPGGYLALIITLGALIYIIYALWRYR
jgi:hypothetical protein